MGGRMRWNTHWSAVTEDYLSREFSKIRDDTGLFHHLSQEERPTFHEIRSLGSDMYLKSGLTIEEVQKMMAHSSDDMTKKYLAGHDNWTKVEANLKL